MKLLTISLAVLLLLIQYPLWFGKGGWKDVIRYRGVLETQIEKNEEVRAINDQIKAEVVDLKTGLDEVEESARSDLNMIKEGEIFFKTLDTPSIDVSD
ncbi:MAG: cell division protein FtsB, partial [Burkholderiales bacterium]